MTATQKDREKSGMRGKGREGKYPVATEQQCINAVKLRHHGKGVSAEAVLRHAAAAAARHGWDRCKAAIKAAREADAKRD